MAWWGNKGDKEADSLPDSVKNMTPQQIADAVQNQSALQSKVTELEGKLAQPNTELEALKAKLAELESRSPVAQPPKVDENRKVSFLEDEDQAFNQRVQPVVGAVLQIGAQVAQSNFESSLSPVERKMYQKYGAELRDAFKENPVAASSLPSWQQTWNMIKGKHLDEITKAAQEGTDFFSAEVNGSPSMPGVVNRDMNVLTDDQKKIAAKLGIKPEDVLKQQKEMQIYHG